MLMMAMRVRKYVQELIEDGLHAVASFVIAWLMLIAALWYKINLTAVLNFNLSVIHEVTRFVPYGYGNEVEFGLRMWGADHILFFGELWFVAAIVIRVLGLCWTLVCYFARWLHRRSRKRPSR